jgi:hypothetical protein
MSVSWIDALTVMEARLEAIESGHEAGPFEPPAVDEPMPAALVGRAEAVVARGDAMQERLEAESARIRAELRRLPRRAAPTQGRARFEVDA